jgi:predicted nucleotidyltransferase
MLSELFKSEDRIRILGYVSEREKVTVQSTAQGTGVSKPVVSRYLAMLIENGLSSREGRTIEWIRTPLGIEIRRLLNIALLEQHLPSPSWAKGIGIYGSFAQGTNTLGSDIDLWVLVDHFSGDLEFRVAELRSALSYATGHEVHILLLTREKITDIATKDIPFYEELMKHQIVLRGKGPDTA